MLLETALAQEGTAHNYVDLVMLYETAPVGDPSAIAYSVQNAGTATAVGVIVSFDLDDLEIRKDSDFSPPPDTTTVPCDDQEQELTCQEFSWKFGSLLPGETSKPFTFPTWTHSGINDMASDWKGRVGTIKATASSNSPEPDMLMANNVIKVYSFGYNSFSRHMPGGELDLLLSVDNLRPDAGGSVAFGLTAQNHYDMATGHYINLIADASVKVKLSEGLKFKVGWSPPDTVKFVKSDTRSATWNPAYTDTLSGGQIGNLHKASDTIEIQTQLTAESLEEIPLEERCYTAWVEDSIPPPSPEYVPGSLKQCLGDEPPLLFTKGSIGVLVPFPCIGTVNHICRDEDGDSASDSNVIVAAAAPLQDETVNLDDAVTVDLALRSQNIIHRDSFRTIADAAFLQPENVVVQVKDPEGRVKDTYATHSLVTSGPSWQTGRKTTSTATPFAHRLSVPGVLVTYTRKTFGPQPGVTTNPWTALNQALSVTKDGADAQSKFRVRSNFTGRTTSFFPFDLTAPSNRNTTSTSVLPYFFQFAELGTYSVTFHVNATHSGTVYPPMESGQHSYATGTYTFHVGPIAELEVQDGGASHHASASQNALTIVAVNNGPDDSLGAQVTGLPPGREVLYKSQGTYDAANGVWDIGELKVKDYYRSGGRPEPTLVLAADAGDTADVTIENSVKYEVCIGSDASTLAHTTQAACEAVTGARWHTTSVYDYISANNTATIAATAGTGGGGDDAPGGGR